MFAVLVVSALFLVLFSINSLVCYCVKPLLSLVFCVHYVTKLTGFVELNVCMLHATTIQSEQFVKLAW